jgi:predicted type IV restriction endonuclease
MTEEINEALKKYAERVQGYKDRLGKWNEDEVKGYLIEPFLKALLWDPTDPNFVRRQYPVTMGSETKKVDYALMSGDSPACVVEAKAGEIDVSDARQALSYARNLDVSWAMVTNGQRVCLYGTEFYKSENIMNALVMDIAISPDNIDVSLDSLRYLANGTLDSEEVYEMFKSLNERRALLVFLQSEKDTLVKVIAKWIEERWGKGSVDEVSLRASLESVFGRIERIEPEPGKGLFPSTGSIVVASDWKYRRDLGKGIFELKTDSSKRIDISQPGPDVERELEKLGLRVSTKSAFGGFYYNLRREAGLIKRR